MRRLICTFLVFGIMSPAFAQERKAQRRSEAAGYSTRDATVLSMVGWGVILGLVTAGVSVGFQSSTTHSH